MNANNSFVYPSPPLLSRLFYVALSRQQVHCALVCEICLRLYHHLFATAFIWSLQVEQLKQDGRLAPPDSFPYFSLREDCEPASKRACADEGISTRSDAVLVELEFTMRGVCTMCPNILQCDTMHRYRLRGSLYKQLIDCNGNPLYTLLIWN